MMPLLTKLGTSLQGTVLHGFRASGAVDLSVRERSRLAFFGPGVTVDDVESSAFGIASSEADLIGRIFSVVRFCPGGRALDGRTGERKVFDRVRFAGRGGIVWFGTGQNR